MTDLGQNQSAMAVYLMGAEPDGTETFPAKTTGNQDLCVTDILDVGGVQGAITVGVAAVAAQVGVSPYTNRKNLTVMPTNGSIFWGYSSAVTTSTGTEIFKNQLATFQVSENVTIWLIAAANRNVRVTEGA
jgi:hypothetical protein